MYVSTFLTNLCACSNGRAFPPPSALVIVIITHVLGTPCLLIIIVCMHLPVFPFCQLVLPLTTISACTCTLAEKATNLSYQKG